MTIMTKGLGFLIAGKVRRVTRQAVASKIKGCAVIYLLIAVVTIILLVSRKVTAPRYILLLLANISGTVIDQQPHIIQPEPAGITFSLQELPSDDKTTLIDMKNFNFTINHCPCNKSQPFLLTLIPSAPEHFLNRQVIRETWGRPTPGMKLLFMIGLSDRYQAQILEEDSKHADIIQGNFQDAYKNMTYKYIMAFKWVIYHCPGVQYILKVDDDTYVNMPAMTNFLERGLSPRQGAIHCHVVKNATVFRSKKSKWYVSPLEYPGERYATYCSGYAVLFTPDSVFLLYRQAQKEPFFWIDDVHITGTIAQRVNLTHASLAPLMLNRKNMIEMIANPSKRKQFLFGPIDLSIKDMKNLHNYTLCGERIV